MYPWLSSSFQRLCQRATANQLHHGLLVKGSEGLGKRFFCQSLAKFLLCKAPQEMACGQCQSCLLFDSGGHPDFHHIDAEKQIGVDRIREAIQKLNGKAQLSGNKVLVIYDAHDMTESSANALLKTLEEPTDKTFIMLITNQLQRLLPTISSRCEKVNLASPTLAVCQQWLAEEGMEDVDESFIRLYHYAPLKIKAELDTGKGLGYDEFVQSLSLIASGQADVVNLAEQYADQAHRVVPWLQHHITSEVSQAVHSDKLWQFYEETQHASSALLNPGINKILLLSKLFSKVNTLTSKFN